METDKIVAAILTASLAAKGGFHDAEGAVSAYREVLKAMDGGEPHDRPLIIAQDTGREPESPNDIGRNLHI